jgi:hypothetical protein
MPRRDVVLTGLIAFGAGVAVGANWKELRKHLGPLLEKLGLKIADLGDFLSAADLAEFGVIRKDTKKPAAKKPSRASKKNGSVFGAANSHRNGNHTSPARAKKRKSPRRQAGVASGTPAPMASEPL